MTVEMTPENRRLRAEMAAHASWARTADRAARTEPARRAAFSKFEQQVDPGGVLDPAERALRAESARKAYFRQMAYRSARVRAERKAKKS